MQYQLRSRLFFVAVFSIALQFILMSCASPSPEPADSKGAVMQERSEEQPLDSKTEDQDLLQIQNGKMEVLDQAPAPASAPKIERSKSSAPKKAKADEAEEAMGADPENPERGGTVITTNN
jgi:hypothetical protein